MALIWPKSQQNLWFVQNVPKWQISNVQGERFSQSKTMHFGQKAWECYCETVPVNNPNMSLDLTWKISLISHMYFVPNTMSSVYQLVSNFLFQSPIRERLLGFIGFSLKNRTMIFFPVCIQEMCIPLWTTPRSSKYLPFQFSNLPFMQCPSVVIALTAVS